jgi:hypothetical protein
VKRLFVSVAGVWLWLSEGCQACELRVPPRPIEYHAIVVGMSPPEETKRQTEIAMRITQGAPNPRYIALPRILAELRDQNGVPHRIISAVIDGHIPAAGSEVILRSRYLDPDDNCRFIPWTVKSPEPVS